MAACKWLQLFLILRTEQFAGYSYNPIAVVKTAMALGHLRLPADLNRPQSRQIRLPERPIIGASMTTDDADHSQDSVVQEVIRHHQNDERVAVIGCLDPIGTLSKLMKRLSSNASQEFSFTTGLLPSMRRPFRAHFFATADAAIRRTLVLQDIVQIRAH